MLSDTERKRLINRDEDSRIRANNDVRIRRKLKAWPKDIADMQDILNHLPEDQIRNNSNDAVIFQLLGLARRFMQIHNFHPLEGDIKTPENWFTIDENNNRNPATDDDIGRSAFVKGTIKDLKDIYGPNNPLDKIDRLSQLLQDPELSDRVSDEEKDAIEEIARIQRDYFNKLYSLIEQQKKPK